MQLWGLCSRLVVALCLLAAGAPAQQTGLIVSPADLNFAVQTGSATPATAILAIATPGQSTAFGVVVRHLAGSPNWLTVSPMSGVTPANVTVSADGSRLAPGTYLAQIAVSAGGLGRVVNVALSVGSTGGTVFGVSPSSLVFVSPAGATTIPSQALQITSPRGAAPFRVTATSSGWLTAAPLTGTTPGLVLVEVHPTGVPAGRFSGTIAITPEGGGTPTVVPVTFISGGAAAADRLRPNQLAILINHHFGAPNAPPAQEVNVNIATFLQWTASTSTPWLRLTSTFETQPAQSVRGWPSQSFSAFAQTDSLAPGTYLGSVTLTAEGLAPVEFPVTLRITTEPALNVHPSSVVLDEVRGYTAGLTVTPTATHLTFTAQATTNNGGNWLRVTPAQGNTSSGSQAITIAAETAGLLPDVYTGAVILQAQNGFIVTIPVRLEVATATTPTKLIAQPTSLALAAVIGEADPVQTLTVESEGGVSHPFTTSTTSETGWLVAEQTSPTAPTRLRVSADLRKIANPGTYTGNIILTSLLNGDQVLVQVTLTLQGEQISAEPSSIAFVQPRRGAAAPPQTLRVSGTVASRFNVVEKPEWVRMSQYVGNTPADITLWAEVSMLPPGTNVGTIRIAGPKNEVNVQVSHREADPAAATITPESVSLQYQVGDPKLPTQTLEVASGGEPGPFTVSVKTASGIDWLRAAPLGGTTPGKVDLTVNPLLLAPGRHEATITIKVDNGIEQTRTVPVVLMVGAPSALIHSVIHGAIQTPSPVTPGMMLTILGNGLGPLLAVTPRPTAAGAYETRIGDTRVLFDNTPAPLLFLKNDQINLIVPYSVYGRASSTMRIEQGSNWSLPIELRVVDSLPGVFTANGSGRGLASATNADGTANSVANPAIRGSTVTLYVTGEGQTDPPGNDGRVILTDVRRPLRPVTARVGGQPAEVVYAGSAPMQVSGIMQVNITIPDESPPGVVPLEVQVGGVNSQSGVTIAVR